MSATAPASAPTAPTRSLRIPLLVALLCLVWSSTWWAIRLSLAEQPPLTSAAVRFTIAGLVMALLAPWLHRREGAAPPPTWLWITTAVTNFAGSYGVLYVAETQVPSGTAAVLWAIFPVLMALSGVTVLGERLTGRQWLGFVVAFAGIVATFGGDLGGVADEHRGYAWLLLLSPLVSAVGTTLVKKFGQGCSSVLLNRNGMLLGAGLLAVVGAIREHPDPTQWTLGSWLATLYLAVLGTAMTFGVYFWLLRTARASQLALINYVTPVLAMLLGVAVGDGTPSDGAWIGTGAVVAGVVLVVGGRRR